MGAFFVEIDFASGTKKFGEVALQTATGTVLPFLIDVNVNRAMDFTERRWENSTATITLNNETNYFTDLMDSSDKFIKGIGCRVYSDTTNIFTGNIYDTPQSDDSEFIILADSKTQGLEKIINKKITKTEFPNCPDINAGKYSNIIFGFASDEGENETGILTAYKVDTKKYLAAWHWLQGFESPYIDTQVFNSSEANITASSSFDNNADGNAYIITSVDQGDEISFNSHGYIDAGLNYITNPAGQLGELNTNFGNYFVFKGIGPASAIYDDRGYNINSMVIDNNISWGEFFKRFAENFDCYFWQKVGGKIGIKVLNWGNETIDSKITENYVTNFRNWRDMENIITQYQRKYWYHYRKTFFHRLPSNIFAGTGWEANEGSLDLRYNRDNVITTDIATRLLFFTKNPLIYYKFSLPYFKGLDVDIADTLELRTYRGYYPYQERLILVTQKKVVNKTNLIEFEAIDINGINDGLLQLWSDNDSRVVTLKEESDPDCNVLL